MGGLWKNPESQLNTAEHKQKIVVHRIILHFNFWLLYFALPFFYTLTKLIKLLFKNTQKSLTENDLPPLSPQLTTLRHILKGHTPVLFSNPHTQNKLVNNYKSPNHLILSITCQEGRSASDLTPLQQIPSYVIPGSADMKGT